MTPLLPVLVCIVNGSMGVRWLVGVGLGLTTTACAASAQPEPTLPPTPVPPPGPFSFELPTHDHDADGGTARVLGLIQFRFDATLDAEDAGSDGFESGFQINRARIGLKGRLPGEHGATYLLLGQAGTTGNPTLLDAWIDQPLTDTLRLRIGQFKLPYDRERYVVSPTNLTAIERSIVDPVFALIYGQGVQFTHTTDRFRVAAAVSDGRRSNNTDFGNSRSADFALSARADTRVGEASWSQFATMSGFPDDASGGLLGVGLHVQEDGNIPLPVGATDAEWLFQYTADAGFEGDGWHTLCAVKGQVIESDAPTVHDMGLLAEAGIFVTDNADIYGRYALVLPDGDRLGGNDPFSAISLGTNYHFVPGTTLLRLTSEVTYYPTAAADSASVISTPNTVQGLLADASGGQVLVSVQLQLLF